MRAGEVERDSGNGASISQGTRNQIRRRDVQRGWLSLLGRYYAQSDRIYFGPNPGTGGLSPGHPFDVELEHDESSNKPFNNSDQANKDIRYFGNWHRFLSAHA